MHKITWVALVMTILFVIFTSNAKAHYVNDDEVKCLASNIYHEARGEQTAGKFAVGFVTLNRVNDSRFPNTICGVVKQGKKDSKGNPIKNKCHFSWYCDGKSDKVFNKKIWKTSLHIAHIILFNQDKIFDFTKGATHYHNTSVTPYWIHEKTKVVKIQNHIFYIWET